MPELQGNGWYPVRSLVCRLRRGAAPIDPCVPRWPVVVLDAAPLYVIGDVHGRLDLLERLEKRITEDAHEAFAGERPWVVLVGDVVDRGPRSAEVLDFVDRRRRESERFVCLRGNHEAMMLSFLSAPSLRHPWLEAGGLETLLSYDPRFEVSRQSVLQTRRLVPEEHVSLLSNLPLAFDTDLAFVSHAGVRSEAALSAQRETDLLWLRDGMQDDYAGAEKLIVHGHQPVIEPWLRGRRINVDTGAYATGTLTAVRLSAGHLPTFLSATAPPVSFNPAHS